MQVFKLIYRLIWANRTSLIIYSFLLIAVTFATTAAKQSDYSQEFQVKKSQIAVFNHDPADPISQHFYDYLQKETQILPVEENPEATADAFFNQEIDYVLTIPEGFGAAIAKGDYQPLEKQEGSDLTVSANMDILCQSYVTNLQIIRESGDGRFEAGKLQESLKTLDQILEKAKIKILQAPKKSNNFKLMAFSQIYTSFLAYILYAIFLNIFGTITLAMSKTEIIKRERMGQLSEGQRLSQRFLGCVSFTWIYWIVLMILGVIIFGSEVLTTSTGRMLVLSSFISTFTIQAMILFIVTLVPNKGLLNFLSTFVPLVIAFGSGLFLPRFLVPDFMQKVISIASPIWQVKANELIVSSQEISGDNWHKILTYFTIQILLGLCYYAMTFVVQKYRLHNKVIIGA